MSFLIVGLGNPGEEYENTRHNVGRIVVEALRKKNKFPQWEFSKNAQALYSVDKIGKEKAELVLPETFMNKSGKSVLCAVTKHKIKPERVVVVYDDLDLPLGKIKISFNRGSGGHKGVESIKRALKTKEFVRVRIGVSPETPSGKLKKPSGEDRVVDFILGKFSAKGGSASGGKKSEMEVLKKISKKATEAIETIVTEGLEKATSQCN